MPLKIISILLSIVGLFLSLSSPEEALGHCPLEKMITPLPYGGYFYISSSSSSTDYSSDISGTPDCRHQDLNLLGREIFFLRNYQAIAEEASQGTGKHLNALATLIGCPKRGFSEFNEVLQIQYHHLFAHDPDEGLLSSLRKVEKAIASHQPLKQVCHDVDFFSENLPVMHSSTRISMSRSGQ